LAKSDRLTVEISPILMPASPGSSLRAELVLHAAAGDAVAWNLLLAAIPATLPACVVRAARDNAIRELGHMLRAAMPGASRHQVASWLAAAGRSLDQGYITACRVTPFLTSGEQAMVDAQICEVLSWLLPRRDGRRWPAWRQIFAILGR